MLRKFAVAAVPTGAALAVTASVGFAATGPGSGGAPGTTAPAPGSAPKATTPYYYAWYTSQKAARQVCDHQLGTGQWRTCTVEIKSGLYYVWFGL